MTISKNIAVISVVLAGVGLLTFFVYQSGVIQKLEQDNNILALSAQDVRDSDKSTLLSTKKIMPVLSNPNGTTAIAIIRPKPKPLEGIILDALENGDFAF